MPNPPTEPRRRWLILLLLVTFGVFAPSLRNGFAVDDVLVAKPMLAPDQPNTKVESVQPLSAYFGANYWAGAGQQSHLYRPVTILSYALLNQMPRQPEAAHWGALPNHLANVLLHLWAVVLVFWLVRAAGGAPRAALVGAAVFALHAVHSEVVSTIIGRADLFAMCFGASALLVCRRAVDCTGGVGPRIGLLAGASALAFLAVCSKESALAWAPFTLVFLWLRGGGARPLALATAAWGIPIGVFLALRASVIATLGEVPPVEYLANPLCHTSDGVRLLNAIMLWGFGLLRTLLPWPCLSEYGPHTFSLASSVLDWRVLVAATALLGCLAAPFVIAARRGAGVWRTQPLPTLAVAAFFGFSFLTTNIPTPIGTVFAERLYYMPSLGASLLAAWLATHSNKAFPILLAGWLLVSASFLWQRNPDWRDNTSLTTSELERNPRSVRTLVNAADILLRNRQLDQAALLLERALRLEPEYALAWNNLAVARLNSGDLDGAEEAIRRGLKAKYELPGGGRDLLHQNRELVGRMRAEQRSAQPPRQR